MGITSSAILVTVALLVSTAAQAVSHKQIVGATEIIKIEEGNLNFKGRVDTGAETSSIHAEDIQVDSSGDPVGKPITFYIVNKDGQSSKIDTQVVSVVTIRTSEGSERRYKVPLTLIRNNSRKTVLVTLNDRTRMNYGLLLGRNWLRGEYIVDVDKNNED